MVEYKDRLKEAMAERGYDATRLAAEMDVTVQAVRKVLDGKSTSFSARNNDRAAEILGVSPGWLARNVLPKYPPLYNDVSNEQTPVPDSRFRPVWVVGRGAGGQMPARIWNDGDYPVGVTDQYAEISSQDRQAFLIEVVGSSMIPRYNPGEFALVEPNTDIELEDDVLVRLQNGETLLKRLLSRKNGYRLGSYNNPEALYFAEEEVTWMYYVAHVVPRKKIKGRV